jgi:hypothetical protein
MCRELAGAPSGQAAKAAKSPLPVWGATKKRRPGTTPALRYKTSIRRKETRRPTPRHRPINRSTINGLKSPTKAAAPAHIEASE